MSYGKGRPNCYRLLHGEAKGGEIRYVNYGNQLSGPVKQCHLN